MALASSVAAWIDTPSRKRAMTPPASARRAGDSSEIGVQKSISGDGKSKLGSMQAYSTVRTQLRVLEQKGYVRHEAVGRGYVYTPVVPADTAQRATLQRVIDTFFSGSAADAIALLRSTPSLGSPRPQRARRSDGAAR
jgi:hypothetical protein